MEQNWKYFTGNHGSQRRLHTAMLLPLNLIKDNLITIKCASLNWKCVIYYFIFSDGTKHVWKQSCNMNKNKGRHWMKHKTATNNYYYMWSYLVVMTALVQLLGLPSKDHWTISCLCL